MKGGQLEDDKSKPRKQALLHSFVRDSVSCGAHSRGHRDAYFFRSKGDRFRLHPPHRPRSQKGGVLRNISFALTVDQFLDGSKDVTRRLGWEFLKPGDKLMACEKCQGIKKGGLVRLGVIEVIHVRRESLKALYETNYGCREAMREGFPQMTGYDFVHMFCEHMQCESSTEVTRIEFKNLGSEEAIDGGRYCRKCGEHLGETCDPFGRSACSSECFRKEES